MSRLPASPGDESAHSQRGACGRRAFLKSAATAGTTAVLAGGVAGPSSAAPDGEPKLPQVRLGPHSISRLICGANCFNAGSHLSVFVNRAMREYYTPEQILKTLRRCEEVGINCWQSGMGNIDLYRRHVAEGGRMRYIAIDAGGPENIRRLAEAGCIAVAHHGETTDQLFKTGRLDQMHEYLKRVRDAGLVVGVSTHMPDVVDAVESNGWDVDYYMTCVYERHRSREALEALLGQAPIPVGEVYLPGDPPRMFAAMRRTARPCLAFKILAAGRLSDRQAWVEQAYRETFTSIKPIDGAIVGIYDRYSDQPAEGAEYVRRFGAVGGG
jgi:hypothetical protein